MGLWLLVAGLGGALSLLGIVALFRRYGRREITGRYLLACLVGLISFSSYALLGAFRPDVATGLGSILILAPGLASIVVLVREHGKIRGTRGPGR